MRRPWSALGHSATRKKNSGDSSGVVGGGGGGDGDGDGDGGGGGGDSSSSSSRRKH